MIKYVLNSAAINRPSAVGCDGAHNEQLVSKWRLGGEWDGIRGVHVIGCKITCGEAHSHIKNSKILVLCVYILISGGLRMLQPFVLSSSLGSGLVPELNYLGGLAPEMRTFSL